MINQILKDPWMWIATVFMGFVQWIIAHSNLLMGALTFAGGVVIFIFGIIEKRKKIKHVDEQRESERVELEIKREQLKQLKNKHYE